MPTVREAPGVRTNESPPMPVPHDMQSIRRAYWRARERWSGDGGPVRWWLRRHRLRRSARRGDVVDVSGVKLRLGPHLSDGVLDALDRGRYERHEAGFVEERLDPDDVVMELGTGLGLVATLCAKRIGSERVFTYEANPALEPVIRDTFALNGVDPTLESCALGVTSGTQPFYVTPSFWASSLVQPRSGGMRIDVPVRAVNDEIARVRPTFLIVDIEGGERDLVPILDFRNVRKLVIELHPYAIGEDETDRVVARLRAEGFDLTADPDAADQYFGERIPTAAA